MRTVVVGVADMAVSDDPEDILVTYSLGSCLGVAIYDPQVQVGGMIHCMLPLSSIDPAKARSRPCMFVDTGIPLLMDTLFAMGVRKQSVHVHVAGAGTAIQPQGAMFRIGERNYAVLRRILWKNGLLITEESVGGAASRTIRMEVATGRFLIKTGGVLMGRKDRQSPAAPGGGGAVRRSVLWPTT